MTEPFAGALARLRGHESAIDEPATRARARSRFFPGMAAALLVTVLVGFAPSFYLRGLLFDSVIWPRIWVHGVFLTAWFVMLFLQATLVARGRVAWHRQIGWLVAAIGLGAALTSLYVTAAAVERGTLVPRTAWSNLANVAAFTAFVVAAVAWRRNAETHKRLMLLASVAFLQPALARLFIWSPLAELGINPVVGGLTVSLLFLLPLVVHDLTTFKRVHAATLIGGASLAAVRLTAVFVVAPSSFGQSVVRWFA